MKSAESWRVFVGLPLGEAFATECQSLMTRLRPSWPEVRWVKPAQVHLTLHFFGNVTVGQVSEIKEMLAPVIAAYRPLILGLQGLGFFPGARQPPRVFWMGLFGDLEKLKKLQRDLEVPLRAKNYPIEGRDFQPHVTIGRFQTREPETKPAPEHKFQERPKLPEVKLDLCKFEHIHLYRSRMTPQGPHYDVLETFLLAQK